MAWRIDEAVIRGEIDNRTRDRVTGRIWFAGRAEPVELDLAGNCWRDLAGRRLEFTNPDPQPGELKGLAARQTGTVGDITASRKVKVPDIPMSQIGEYYAAKKKWTWHWGNSLYLEWFSDRNGRVVIESAIFQLTISPEIAWDMTPEEEATQRGANVEAMGGFMGRLGKAVAAERAAKGEPADDPPEAWSEEPPVDEASADEPGTGAESEEPWDEAAELAAWDRPRHPLAKRASESWLRFHKEAEQHGWMPAGASDEHPVADMVLTMRDATRKIAGALGHHPWPPSLPVICEDAIERLRRARGYFDHALLAAAYCEQAKLADAAWVAGVQREINALAFECAKLIAELHARLPRKTDPEEEGPPSEP